MKSGTIKRTGGFFGSGLVTRFEVQKRIVQAAFSGMSAELSSGDITVSVNFKGRWTGERHGEQHDTYEVILDYQQILVSEPLGKDYTEIAKKKKHNEAIKEVPKKRFKLFRLFTGEE